MKRSPQAKSRGKRAAAASGGRRRELWGLLLLAAALFGLVWDAHPSGALGVLWARAASFAVGGAALPWLLFLLLIAILMVRGSDLRPALRWGTAVLLLWWTMLIAAAGWTGSGSDAAGRYMMLAADALLGSDGRDILLGLWPILTLSLVFRPFLGQFLRGSERVAKESAKTAYRKVTDFVMEDVPGETAAAAAAAAHEPPRPSAPVQAVVPEPEPLPAQRVAPAPWDEPLPQAAQAPQPARQSPQGQGESPALFDGSLRPAAGEYRLPPLSILHAGSGKHTERDAPARAHLLEETLRSFGVQARVLEYQQGPAVTRFEVQPGPGVKVSRIVALADDIALAMAATDVRMEAPIPGKAAIGIEIPNSEIAPVRLREVLEAPAFRASSSLLTVGLGKDIAGNAVVAELERMPHLLIAGATGSGKSVCLNVLIASLLFRASPAEVRLILIDPKVVELQQFDGIPHLLYPVVTDPKRAAGVLRGVLREMEERYLQFARAGCRDIQRYNEVAAERMPYYVVVIDELADLMMVAPNEVEETIARLAQMARAAGIHLVVATQRPSVDVITGLIKANIPSRIAFAVSSQVDSRTILDQGGAERLLGKGDMLFAPLGLAKPLRTQGAYVSEQEMQRLLEFVRQDEPEYRDDLEAPIEGEEDQEPEVDALFAKAVEVVVQAKSASASLLQSRMRVGYSRARRLIEQMEQRGIVGPPDGSRPREVRLSQFDYERLFPPEVRG